VLEFEPKVSHVRQALYVWITFLAHSGVFFFFGVIWDLNSGPHIW
jgi:hypothetical protein